MACRSSGAASGPIPDAPYGWWQTPSLGRAAVTLTKGTAPSYEFEVWDTTCQIKLCSFGALCELVYTGEMNIQVRTSSPYTLTAVTEPDLM